MGTSWKAQLGDGAYCLQFQTDDKEKYKFVEKAAQMVMDGKHNADVVEVRHGYWKDNNNGTFTCSECGGKASKMNWCGCCGAKMDKERKEK